jgi:hypothetical protein
VRGDTYLIRLLPVEMKLEARTIAAFIRARGAVVDVQEALQVVCFVVAIQVEGATRRPSASR